MSWNPERLSEEAYAMASTTSTNDPRQHHWGVFFWADAPAACGGGAGHFHWVGSLDEALTLLTDYSPAMFMTFGDDEKEWLEFRNKLRCIATDFKEEPSRCLDALNRELSGLLQIDWIGTFQELCTSSIPFCQRIRADFLKIDAETPSKTAIRSIPPEEEQEFCEWLAMVGV